MLRIPWEKVRWANSLFLISTFVTTVTAVPLYIMRHGVDAFQLGLFLFFFIATGLSITLGYHRLFSHLTFNASWPVKVFTLLFGAAAFEGSALGWSADHRRHHKFVDHDDDPYDISKGFFHAHIGWLLFRTGPDTPLTWVRDLQKDKLAWWQHQYYVPLAFGVGFGLPALIGYLWGGPTAALGAFLMAGVARVVFVHHMTFCINSLCHWIGDRPYSTNCTARDSFLMALFTFGEGYHNFHHEFQYDYRNGVKPWQFDPTKWSIWLLHKLGLVRNLRTVPEEKILKAQIAEQQRRIAAALESHPAPLSESLQTMLHSAQQQMHDALAQWEQRLTEYRAAKERRHEISRRQRRQLKRELAQASSELREALGEWMSAHRIVFGGTAAA
ncbi:stearoyl-CoA desaturase [Terrimicrobium sacchariphilum]|uniref:Stearoyl-CoA desaturase n=1 Tax=Terrimicrobium sacchariphilum TaxID=690879 RepID=A0A146GCI8_TERSA|nr:fatty acid desaturase [Terrimicrobium sacchariphilum]GAT34872.1 stearoyl-CoA desaturase [Terrimicrobium sacchariphilum]